MKCTNCGKEIPAGLAFCSECGTALVKPDDPLGGKSGTRDIDNSNDLIYPRKPPLSPLLALLFVLFPGIGQILFGQTLKGIAMLVVFFFGVPTQFLAFAVMIIGVIDGYMVGNTLQNGNPVRKWQFFPNSEGNNGRSNPLN